MKILDQTFMHWWEKNSGRYCGLLFDIDGTLIAGRKVMPGAAALIKSLEASNFPFYLLTNDGNHSAKEKSSMLQRAGIDIKPDKIVSCADALVPFVEKHRLKGQKFFVMGDLGKPNFAEKAGLKVERGIRKICECQGVIVGEGVYNWQSNMNAAMNFFIKYPDRFLVVPNPDSYWPNGASGELGIGAGGKARFICSILSDYGIRKTPVYLGKPYGAIFAHAVRILTDTFNLPHDLRKGQILMLGDSLASDIHGANAFGLTSGLVLTGITNRTHLQKAKPAFRPDFVFPRIS